MGDDFNARVSAFVMLKAGAERVWLARLRPPEPSQATCLQAFIRVNGLGLQGFPEIVVGLVGKDFHVIMKFGDHPMEFTLTRDEAKRAVTWMKAKKSYSDEIFDRVQDALSKLEGACRRG